MSVTTEEVILLIVDVLIVTNGQLIFSILGVPNDENMIISEQNQTANIWKSTRCKSSSLLHAREKCITTALNLHIITTPEDGCRFYQDVLGCTKQLMLKSIRCQKHGPLDRTLQFGSTIEFQHIVVELCTSTFQEKILRDIFNCSIECGRHTIEGLWQIVEKALHLEQYFHQRIVIKDFFCIEIAEFLLEEDDHVMKCPYHVLVPLYFFLLENLQCQEYIMNSRDNQKSLPIENIRNDSVEYEQEYETNDQSNGNTPNSSRVPKDVAHQKSKLFQNMKKFHPLPDGIIYDEQNNYHRVTEDNMTRTKTFQLRCSASEALRNPKCLSYMFSAAQQITYNLLTYFILLHVFTIISCISLRY